MRKLLIFVTIFPLYLMAINSYKYIYYGYESNHKREAKLMFNILNKNVNGIMLIKGSQCKKGQPLWLSGEVKFNGHLTNKIPQVKGVAKIKLYSNCSFIKNYSMVSKGYIDIGYNKKEHLFVKLYKNSNSKSSIWYFLKHDSSLPDNPFGVSANIPSIAGVWQTSFGKMILKQKGSNVWGSYTHDKGKIVGNLQGKILTGTWSESPTYSPPKDAGTFQFIFDFKRNKFNGWWKYGFSGKWEDTWDGYKDL